MKNILIFDDHQLFNDVLKESFRLSPDEYKVFSATELNEAKRILDSENIDLMILDLSIPDVDPIGNIEKIKRAHPQTRILVISSCTDPVTIKSAVKYGASGYLTKKEADIEDIFKAVKTLTEGEQYFCRYSKKIIVESP